MRTIPAVCGGVVIILWLTAVLAAASTCNEQHVSPEQLKKAQDAAAVLERKLPDAVDPTSVLYEIARTYAEAGEKAQALDALNKAFAMTPDLDVSIEAFACLRDSPEFKAMLAKAGAKAPPVQNSRVAFKISGPDLVTEGMSYDPVRERFFLGSVFEHMIIEILSQGEYRAFLKHGRDGVGEVLGLKADPKTQSLWAASNSSSGSAVYRFAIPSGKLTKKYEVPGNHLLNDLVVAPDGDVFVTDSKAGTVFRIAAREDKVEDFGKGLSLVYPNGIAVSPDGGMLFVADENFGIALVDIASRRARSIARPREMTLASIDGMYFYDGSLIAIQNEVVKPRVVRLFLNSSLNGIDRLEVLERDNPHFDIPTTGAIADGKFYYIADSQIDHLKDGKLRDPKDLRPILILSLKLK